jgi:hypothetical protein
LVGEVENTPVPDSSSASAFFAERGWLGVLAVCLQHEKSERSENEETSGLLVRV